MKDPQGSRFDLPPSALIGAFAPDTVQQGPRPSEQAHAGPHLGQRRLLHLTDPGTQLQGAPVDGLQCRLGWSNFKRGRSVGRIERGGIARPGERYPQHDLKPQWARCADVEPTSPTHPTRSNHPKSPPGWRAGPPRPAVPRAIARRSPVPDRDT